MAQTQSPSERMLTHSHSAFAAPASPPPTASVESVPEIPGAGDAKGVAPPGPAPSARPEVPIEALMARFRVVNPVPETGFSIRMSLCMALFTRGGGNIKEERIDVFVSRYTVQRDTTTMLCS